MLAFHLRTTSYQPYRRRLGSCNHHRRNAHPEVPQPAQERTLHTAGVVQFSSYFREHEQGRPRVRVETHRTNRRESPAPGTRAALVYCRASQCGSGLDSVETAAVPDSRRIKTSSYRGSETKRGIKEEKRILISPRSRTEKPTRGPHYRLRTGPQKTGPGPFGLVRASGGKAGKKPAETGERPHRYIPDNPRKN